MTVILADHFHLMPYRACETVGEPKQLRRPDRDAEPIPRIRAVLFTADLGSAKNTFNFDFDVPGEYERADDAEDTPNV